MRPWRERPPETAFLHNPAFCGEICRRAIHAHARRGRGSFPLPLLYLVLPLVLDRRIRDKIRENTRQKMHAWLQDHPELRVGFADHVRASSPTSMEALSYLFCTGAARVDESGIVLSGYAPAPLSKREDDVAHIFRKSTVVGRWFADSGTPESVYMMWGIRP
ncbi:conserved hypothetical protein [Rubrobacter radiotolerans DSM 5868]|nr:conserved hypothetical protein [Rubrobacter radiotolerans DSM 5868]